MGTSLVVLFVLGVAAVTSAKILEVKDNHNARYYDAVDPLRYRVPRNASNQAEAQTIYQVKTPSGRYLGITADKSTLPEGSVIVPSGFVQAGAINSNVKVVPVVVPEPGPVAVPIEYLRPAFPKPEDVAAAAAAAAKAAAATGYGGAIYGAPQPLGYHPYGAVPGYAGPAYPLPAGPYGAPVYQPYGAPGYGSRPIRHRRTRPRVNFNDHDHDD